MISCVSVGKIPMRPNQFENQAINRQSNRVLNPIRNHHPRPDPIPNMCRINPAMGRVPSSQPSKPLGIHPVVSPEQNAPQLPRCSMNHQQTTQVCVSPCHASISSRWSSLHSSSVRGSLDTNSDSRMENLRLSNMSVINQLFQDQQKMNQSLPRLNKTTHRLTR